MTLQLMGRSLDVVAAGHLSLAPSGSRVVVDSIQVGSLPWPIAALAANTILGAANIQGPGEIREVTTTAKEATLKGQR